MFDLDKIKSQLDEAVAKAYADGYSACRDDMLTATSDASLPRKEERKGAKPKASLSETERAGRQQAAKKSKHHERDNQVLDVFRASPVGRMRQKDVENDLLELGDRVAPSSLRVVLTRLVEQDQLVRDGRYYALSEDPNDELSETRAPESDEPGPFQANGRSDEQRGSGMFN